MSQNGNDLIRSITIASPVLLAAALSVVLAVSAILNPDEDTFSPTILDYNDTTQNGGDDGGATGLFNLTAVELYEEYREYALDPELSLQIVDAIYKDKIIIVTGELASWGTQGINYIAVLSSDYDEDATLIQDFVRFVFAYPLTQLTLEGLPGRLGSRVTLTGICRGWEDGYVIIEVPSTDDFTTEEPIQMG